MTLSVAAGTLIDERYRVLSRVGSGGMAEVYCAEDVQLGRRVAVKLLHERFAADEEFVERFRREASSAASLSHANIVAVYDRGEWAGTYYIAMEYLEGRSLDAIVREEAPLAPDRAMEITEQVLRAARFAHRRGVVHRDLKPHNVIIDEEGRVKVTDFGIARAGASEITQTGSIMGTARYLSPEQAQGNTVSPRSDIYAIGVMLYELLTGAVPFEGESVVAIALRHLSEPPRPPSALVPQISPALDAIVLRALAKDPAQRFADADEFLAALEGERARDRGDTGAATAALAPVVVAPAPYANPSTYTTQSLGPITGQHVHSGVAWWDPSNTGVIPPGTVVLPAGARQRGPVWPWVLIGVIVAAAAAVAIVLLLGKKHHTPPATKATVPSVIGQSAENARAHVQAAGYEPSSQFVASLRRQGIVVGQRPRGHSSYTKGSIVVLDISLGPGSTKGQVPNVVNSTLSDAEHALRASHFKVSTVKQPSTTVPKRHVISTNPAGGSTQPHDSTVVITYSSGPPATPVPNVVGDTLQQAQFLLQQKNFVVSEKQKTSSQPVGTVLAQSPASGKAPQGSTVTLTVAKAPPNVKVPFLLGQTAASAGALLGGEGLTPNETTVVKHVNPQYDGQVISQKPKPGKSVPPGTTVTIVIESYQAPGGPTGPTGGTTGPTSGSTGVSSNGGTGSTAATGAT